MVKYKAALLNNQELYWISVSMLENENRRSILDIVRDGDAAYLVGETIRNSINYYSTTHSTWESIVEEKLNPTRYKLNLMIAYSIP